MNCDCIAKIDEKLKEKNLRLIGFAFVASDFNMVPTVNTEWIDPTKAPKGMKNRPTKMFASHCPFCGKAVKMNERVPK